MMEVMEVIQINWLKYYPEFLVFFRKKLKYYLHSRKSILFSLYTVIIGLPNKNTTHNNG